MKLSQVRPCDNCGKPIAPIFYVIRTSIAVFNANATNEMLGLARMFHGSLALAETLGSQPEAVTVGSDQDHHLQDEIFLCQDCYVSNVNIAVLVEKVSSNKVYESGNE